MTPQEIKPNDGQVEAATELVNGMDCFDIPNIYIPFVASFLAQREAALQEQVASEKTWNAECAKKAEECLDRAEAAEEKVALLAKEYKDYVENARRLDDESEAQISGLAAALKECGFIADLAVGRDAPREAYARILGVVDAALRKEAAQNNKGE